MRADKIDLWSTAVPDLGYDGMAYRGTCPACGQPALELRVLGPAEFEPLCHTPGCSGSTATEAARLLLQTPPPPSPHPLIPSSPHQPFPLLSLDDVCALPPPVYQIEGFLYEQSLTQIFGEPGHGKTFLTLDLALACAAGSSHWLGRRLLGPGPVVWVNADGGRGHIPRLSAWRRVHPGPLAHPFLTLMGELPLHQPGPVARFIDQLAPSPPRLLVLDTLSACIPGVDENSAAEMSAVMRSCRRLQQELACSVILIHHTDKSGQRDRGHSLIKAAVDLQVRVQKEAGSRQGIVSAEKCRDSERFSPFSFWLQPTGLSCVVVAQPRLKTPPTADPGAIYA